jgi:hypothetical protein
LVYATADLSALIGCPTKGYLFATSGQATPRLQGPGHLQLARWRDVSTRRWGDKLSPGCPGEVSDKSVSMPLGYLSAR